MYSGKKSLNVMFAMLFLSVDMRIVVRFVRLRV